jgi:hypothetical protein
MRTAKRDITAALKISALKNAQQIMTVLAILSAALREDASSHLFRLSVYLMRIVQMESTAIPKGGVFMIVCRIEIVMLVFYVTHGVDVCNSKTIPLMLNRSMISMSMRRRF